MHALVEINGRRLGDLALDVPLLRLLARKYPDIDLEIVLSEHLSSLVEDCSFVHWKHMLAQSGLTSQARAFTNILLSTWNLVVLGEGSRLRWVRPLMRSELVLAPGDRDEAARPEGAIVHRMSVLRSIVPDWHEGITAGIPLLPSRAEHARRLAGVNPSERVLALAPGSDMPARWPVSTAASTAAVLREHFDKVVVMGRAADSRHCVNVATAVGCQALAGSVPMPYNCALLAHIGMLIGTDECMAHVAASYGTPTLLVGAPADSYRHPWRQESIVGAAGSIAASSVADRAKLMLDRG